jgi:hypothetical protein
LTAPRPCARCLAPGHARSNCHWPIRCSTCRVSRHVMASCPVVAFKRGQSSNGGNGKAALVATSDWFKISEVPGPSSPPIFNSFGEMEKALLLTWAPQIPRTTVGNSWAKPASPCLLGCQNAATFLNVEPALWSLATSSASPPSS